MIIIGEKINGTLKTVKEAILNRDRDFIADLARRQAEAGANYLDVNAGTAPEREVEDFKWLIDIVQGEVEVPICLDSPNPKSLAQVISLVKKPGIINSVSAELGKEEQILPLAKEYGFSVIALTIDEKGIPKDAQTRVDIASRIIQNAGKYEIGQERIFVDPLVVALSSGDTAGIVFLETVALIKERFPNVKVVSGLSNISYSLPVRKVINRTFFVKAEAAGMDAAIMDPLDKELLGTVYAVNALKGKDRFCRSFINAYRKELIG